MKKCFAALLTLAAIPATAEETRELSSHEHGVGELNIAIDGGALAMELRAPGADIVGFEYAPESDEDRKMIESALEALSQPDELFILPDQAKCSVAYARVELEGDEKHDEHDEHDEHDTAGHREFHAEYQWNCDAQDALVKISFGYFDTFPSALELDVQIATQAGAKALEVKRDDPSLDLREIN